MGQLRNIFQTLKLFNFIISKKSHNQFQYERRKIYHKVAWNLDLADFENFRHMYDMKFVKKLYHVNFCIRNLKMEGCIECFQSLHPITQIAIVSREIFIFVIFCYNCNFYSDFSISAKFRFPVEIYFMSAKTRQFVSKREWLHFIQRLLIWQLEKILISITGKQHWLFV